MAGNQETGGRGQLLPTVVSEALARGGQVQMVSGQGDEQSSVRLFHTPFDDMLALFASPGSKAIENLLRSPACEVLAGGTEPPWTLRMRGRAIHAGLASTHPRRMEVAPWLPEGMALHRIAFIEFIPERIEYTEGQGEECKTWHGPTAAARTPNGLQRWGQASFGGLWPFFAIGSIVDWVWLGWWGTDFRFRVLALAMTLFVSLGLMGSGRLLFLGSAFLRWQRGTMRRRDASLFADGLLAWGDARLVSWLVLGLAACCLIFMGAAWGGSLVLVALGASFVWILGPYWIARLTSPKEMEAVGDEGLAMNGKARKARDEKTRSRNER